MKISQRYKIGQESLVYKNFNGLYELKLTGKLWNKMFIKILLKISFIYTNADFYILTY